MKYPLLDVFLTLLLFFLWIVWVWLLIMIISDIFRSRDLSGWAKAGWLVLVVLLPLLGVLIYLIARGDSMHQRQAGHVQDQDQAMRAYVDDAAGTTGNGRADELAKLAGLRDRGVISDAEFEQGKAKVLS